MLPMQTIKILTMDRDFKQLTVWSLGLLVQMYRDAVTFEADAMWISLTRVC